MTERDLEGQALDLRLLRVMRNMARVMFESIRRDVDSYGLSSETFQILELLYSKGPHPIQKISDTLAIPSGSITYVIDKLEKKAFVQRVPIPGDRRKMNVTMTGEGKAYFDDIFPKHAQMISDNFSFVTDEEKLQLISLMKKIGFGIRDRQSSE